MSVRSPAVVLGVISVLGLTACTVAAPTARLSTPVEGAHFSVTGWVRFEGEEFRFYGNPESDRPPFSGSCVSGAASRAQMDQARQGLDNSRVTISGRMMPWSGRDGSLIRHRGSVVRNSCGGDTVLLADDIRPAN